LFDPERRIVLYPSPKRVRAVLGGETVADSTAAILLLEQGHAPVYYFPRADVRMERLARTGRRTHCPHKGDAAWWTVEAGGRRAEDAAWSYEAPFEAVAAISGRIAFYWDRMDAWYEEDERIAVHPRSPYHRIDILNSARRVTVELAGATLAETTNARFLFETGLPARYYVPQEDVRTSLLIDSRTTSACPYKGSARYWSARIGGRVHPDVAWSYPLPLPEARKIAGHLCFDPARVDRISVDGAAVGQP
jgi:uncharacterized protein (DUF427 family)